MNNETLTYKEKTYKFIYDPSIESPCNYCDFKQDCNNYVDEELWMACGATFSSNKIYLKLIDGN